MLPVLIASLSVYLVFLVAHIVPFKLHPIQARTRTLTLVMLFCTPLLYPAFYGARAILPDVPALRTLAFVTNTALVFLLLWFSYLLFYFAFERSPSLRFLVETLNSEQGRLDPEKLSARFSFEDVIRRRIEQMLEAGVLIVRDGKYCNSAKGQNIGKWGQALKSFFHLGKGG